MGLTDRLAKAIAEQIQKAPRLPAGSEVLTEQDMKNRSGSQTYGPQTPLQRNPIWPNVPFGPGNPIFPGAINPLRTDGRADPRRYEYQVAQNINVATEQKLVPFKTLRGAAEQIDIIRRCIEVLKSKVTALDWDITIATDASEKIIAEIGGDHVRAMARARDKFSEEIYRVRSFWEKPDRANGLSFTDWLSMALEEILVLDAWAIWPQQSVGGDLYGLQIIDGSTIKPLLDDRGMRPLPPNPAFQQILYGFPRSEFTAETDQPEADGEFTSDELSYIVRNRRANSAYGNSPVERCLPVADLYLRRQQWLRAEYTDGVLPELMFQVDPDFGNDPRLLREIENALNDDLAGQTEQRHRAKVLPAGFKPVTFDGYGEKFKDMLDTYLVTSICGHFAVLPTEIGFSGHGGLGNSGHQAGEAEAAQQIGVGPLVHWLEEKLTDLSHSYLGLPRELTFKFMLDEGRDTEQSAKKSDMEIRGATKTINERRSELGLPLLDTPAADQPMLVAGNGVFIFTPDGIVNATEAATNPDLSLENSPIAPQSETPASPIAPAGSKPAPETTTTAEGSPVPAATEQAQESESQTQGEAKKGGVPNEATAAEALARLAQLPNPAGDVSATDPDAEDLIMSPWPAAKDIETLNGEDNYPVDPDVWNDAELTMVGIKDLYCTDTVLNRDKVAERIESLGQSLKPYRNYPLVYDDGEKLVIVDGHHRLMAMWLLGMDRVPVWIARARSQKAVSREIASFFRWSSKGRKSKEFGVRDRKFVFKHVEPIVAEALLRCHDEGDMDTAKALAKAYTA